MGKLEDGVMEFGRRRVKARLRGLAPGQAWELAPEADRLIFVFGWFADVGRLA